ncbi:MAG: STAS domain-containing protein [Trinickia sp.]|jgi:anti-anti-sigma factor
MSKFSVEGELTIYHVAERRAELQRALIGATDSFLLDLASVTELDSAGVQLLLAVRRRAIAAGIQWRIVALSDAAREVFKTLGVDADLADWPTMQTSPQRC